MRTDPDRRSLKNQNRPEIPRKTVYRLSVYLRCLQRLRANGIQTVSSEVLAKGAGVKSAQLRKDLAYFGQFGTRGLGYEVELLAKMLSAHLGTSRLQQVILVGVGNLGRALLSYKGFQQEGFEIIGAFDADPNRDRTKDACLPPICSMEELCGFLRKKKVKMAIIAVPATAAQAVANELVKNKIVGILNFSPAVLQVPNDVVVNNVNLAIELENLSYFVHV